MNGPKPKLSETLIIGILTSKLPKTFVLSALGVVIEYFWSMVTQFLQFLLFRASEPHRNLAFELSCSLSFKYCNTTAKL